ncbi:uncharacterized protein FOMMEDRAFT_151284 [Fomitiporia mediterranea MF3/22]|uniref:uncharacterized protein n=1 Tax=Fomitiporia mediterranea (strain MF3/22) TaxID=694068 RepID=UPI000440971B|nr:uncharacterized protein FOMMEDRAFT_151284 [Fomitiporia mediterranea MF3/22]EJD08427.1 hypothetical protein FOMMEDRAFT_151284 [Fomitiporia mediterranea MF3/22]
MTTTTMMKGRGPQVLEALLQPDSLVDLLEELWEAMWGANGHAGASSHARPSNERRRSIIDAPTSWEAYLQRGSAFPLYDQSGSAENAYTGGSSPWSHESLFEDDADLSSSCSTGPVFMQLRRQAASDDSGSSLFELVEIETIPTPELPNFSPQHIGPQALRTRVTRPFLVPRSGRIHRTPYRAPSGVGLGLFNVPALAFIHAGTISAASPPPSPPAAAMTSTLPSGQRRETRAQRPLLRRLPVAVAELVEAGKRSYNHARPGCKEAKWPASKSAPQGVDLGMTNASQLSSLHPRSVECRSTRETLEPTRIREDAAGLVWDTSMGGGGSGTQDVLEWAEVVGAMQRQGGNMHSSSLGDFRVLTYRSDNLGRMLSLKTSWYSGDAIVEEELAPLFLTLCPSGRTAGCDLREGAGFSLLVDCVPKASERDAIYRELALFAQLSQQEGHLEVVFPRINTSRRISAGYNVTEDGSLRAGWFPFMSGLVVEQQAVIVWKELGSFSSVVSSTYEWQDANFEGGGADPPICSLLPPDTQQATIVQEELAALLVNCVSDASSRI